MRKGSPFSNSNLEPLSERPVACSSWKFTSYRTIWCKNSVTEEGKACMEEAKERIFASEWPENTVSVTKIIRKGRH